MTTSKKIFVMMIYLIIILILILVIKCPVFQGHFNGHREMKTRNEINISTEDKQLSIKELIVSQEEIKPLNTSQPKFKEMQYRLTSFYVNDGYGTSNCTGSGLCTDDFQVNEKGWYTYKGKLVMAGATNECLKSKQGACGKWNIPEEGRHYFNYFDEIKVKIDDVIYEAIILDSCGASMYVKQERLDLFVKTYISSEEQIQINSGYHIKLSNPGKYAIDRGYKGNNFITVFLED